MSGDLGGEAAEVHAAANAIRRFWFEELSPKRWFAKDDKLDAEIARRFSTVRDLLVESGAQGWRDAPDSLLAAVIALDQFSRNIHRGAAEAFAADPLARELTLTALDCRWDRAMADHERQFLYMPLMHTEDLAVQDRSVALFEDLGIVESTQFARDHRDVIARFGRFPSRNAALGRTSTAAEREYLSRPDAGW